MGDEVYFEEGKRLFVEGKLKESVDAFTRALEAGSDPSITYLSRGAAHLNLGAIESALVDFTAAIETGKKSSKAYYYRGMAFTAKEDFERAAADFSKAVEIKPDNAAALFARGASYIRMNRLEEAGQDIKNAVNYAEAELQGYADMIGDRTHLDAVRAVLEGEKRATSLGLSDAEFETVKKLLMEK